MIDEVACVLRFVTPAFTDQELEIISRYFKPRAVRRNEILVGQGEICKEFYLVAEGCIRVYFLDKKGNEKTGYIMPAHHIGTALSSFIDQKPSFEFVDALQDTQLLIIDRRDFFRLNHDMPNWKIFYQTMLEMAYSFRTRRIESIVTLNAQQRFDQAMKETPALIETVSNRVMASYLDITPETLSRLKTKVRPS